MTHPKVCSHRRETSKTVEGWIFLITGSVATFMIGLVSPMIAQL